MTFHALDQSIALLSQLRPLVARIRSRDKKLANRSARSPARLDGVHGGRRARRRRCGAATRVNQIVDAANSVAQSLGEGVFSDPGNRRARYHTAAGSASEVRAGLRAAEAWGYLTPSQSFAPLQNLDGLLAVLWKLTR